MISLATVVLSPAARTAATAAVIGVFGLLATFTGNLLVQRVFADVDAQRSRVGSAPDRKESPSLQAAGAVLPGGRWIGPLERVAVYASLCGGWPEGIAVVLAVKGLARYPELRATTSGAAERFIIGTFVSVLYAAALAGIAVWLRGLFS